MKNLTLVAIVLLILAACNSNDYTNTANYEYNLPSNVVILEDVDTTAFFAIGLLQYFHYDFVPNEETLIGSDEAKAFTVPIDNDHQVMVAIRPEVRVEETGHDQPIPVARVFYMVDGVLNYEDIETFQDRPPLAVIGSGLVISGGSSVHQWITLLGIENGRLTRTRTLFAERDADDISNENPRHYILYGEWSWRDDYEERITITQEQFYDILNTQEFTRWEDMFDLTEQILGSDVWNSIVNASAMPEDREGISTQFDNLGFSVEFPAFWEGRYGVEKRTDELDGETAYFASIYHIATRDELYALSSFEYGGRILTLGRVEGEHFTYINMPGSYILLARTGGYTYFVNFPSGIEFNMDDPNSEAAAEYLEMIGHWEEGHWDFLENSFRLLNGVEISSNILTDAEIEALYKKAIKAYGWFDMTTMPLDTTYEEVDENGFVLWRVDFSGIETMANLEAYLSSIFTSEIVDELLTDSRYREFDGILYAIGADRGGMLDRGDETHEIIRESNEKIIYRVTVDVLDIETLEDVVDTVVYDFVLALVDGNWLFSNFNLTR